MERGRSRGRSLVALRVGAARKNKKRGGQAGGRCTCSTRPRLHCNGFCLSKQPFCACIRSVKRFSFFFPSSFFSLLPPLPGWRQSADRIQTAETPAAVRSLLTLICMQQASSDCHQHWVTLWFECLLLFDVLKRVGWRERGGGGGAEEERVAKEKKKEPAMI